MLRRAREVGYPRGLAGESIPLGARIFSVADTCDSMTRHRPYRGALPYEAAAAETAGPRFKWEHVSLRGGFAGGGRPR